MVAQAFGREQSKKNPDETLHLSIAYIVIGNKVQRVTPGTSKTRNEGLNVHLNITSRTHNITQMISKADKSKHRQS